MRARLLLLALLIVVASQLASVAYAFNGERKGFILGLGAGPGITSYSLEVDGESGDDESKFGLNTDFRIGYAPSDLVQIYWMSKVAWFSQEFVTDFTYDPYTQEYDAVEEDVTVATGVAGLGATYFFQPTAPSPFILGGIGYSSFSTPFESDSESQIGFGIAAGGGYEFAKHWTIEGTLTYGKPSEDDFSWSVVGLKATINWLGY
jgi:opacity protein-like surface antigen